MKGKTNKLLAAVALLLCCTTTSAKSLVIELNNGLKIFYVITKEAQPRMVIAQDGTFMLNTRLYSFSDVKSFHVQNEDYSGEKNTEDAIVLIQDDSVQMTGNTGVFTLDGRRVSDKADLSQLKPGTYVISNGKQTFKIVKP